MAKEERLPNYIAYKESISPAQCRAARALLNWSQKDLEKASNVTTRSIVDFERENKSMQIRTIQALCAAFEMAGVVFISRDDGGPGLIIPGQPD